MLIFQREGLVLFAMPKTGTTALEAVLAPRASTVFRDPPALKHSTVVQYERLILPAISRGKPPRLETVAVIRHPVDWLGSWYRYRHRDEIVGHRNSTRGMSFDEFVIDYCLGRPSPPAAIGSQARFVRRADGTVGVDRLFRYEAFDTLVAHLERRLGTPIRLPRRNVSPEMPLTLSPAVEAQFRVRRADEFAVWDAALP